MSTQGIEEREDRGACGLFVTGLGMRAEWVIRIGGQEVESHMPGLPGWFLGESISSERLGREGCRRGSA